MACKLVLKAPNGRDSILFKDIAEASTVVDDAINMYFYTKTDGFLEEYQGRLDINGEPIYDEMKGKEYVHDVDYAKVELDHAADVFKRLMGTVPDLITKIEDRIEYLQYKGDNTHVLKLQGLLDILQTESVNTSIPKFFEMASKHVDGLHNIAAEAFKERVKSVDDLK